MSIHHCMEKKQHKAGSARLADNWLQTLIDNGIEAVRVEPRQIVKRDQR